MMRIGIDIRLIGKQRTGDEVVFFNLVKNFEKFDQENEYYLFTEQEDEEKLKEIAIRLHIQDSKNFKIISITCRNRFLWNLWDLPKYLRHNPVDVYLTQYITPFFVPRKIKIVTIIHDISFNFFPQFIKKSDLFFLKLLLPFSLRRANRILGVSEFTKNEIVSYYKTDPAKVDYFHNAVPDDFKKEFSNQDLAVIRKKYNLPEKFILYLGTLQPRKNLPFLIESYASVRDSLGGAKLVLAGNRKGHNFDTGIDEAIKKHDLGDDVIFPGYIDDSDKFAIYKASHVFVLPSLYEGFGIPILESFSAQTPVLASDIPSLREVAGKAAKFASPTDIEKFSKALYDISVDNNSRKDLVSDGSARAGFFSWEKTARKVISVLKALN